MNQIIIGKTKKGVYELVAIEYDWIGDKYIPSPLGAWQLKKYVAWKNLSVGMQKNPFMSNLLKKAFGEFVK